MSYSREALRVYRERKATPPEQRSLLPDIPPDVAYADAVLTCWDGKAFVTWQEWRAKAPIEVEEAQQPAPEEPRPVEAGKAKRRQADTQTASLFPEGF